MASDEYFMDLALKQAEFAFSLGEFPVGCVIVQDDAVIAGGSRQGTRGELAIFSEIDHAEIRALKSLETTKVPFVPQRATIYVTMEPCLMCFGAIILTGIRKIVYAYEDPMGGGTGCELDNLPSLYRNADMEIVSGVLRWKSLELFCSFFDKKSNRYWKNSYLEKYTLSQIQECRFGNK